MDHKLRKLGMLQDLQKFVTTCTMCNLGYAKDLPNRHVFSNMTTSRWMVVGQNPGANERIQGAPFVGDSGTTFMNEIAKYGLIRDNFYITNAVKCYTDGNEKPNISYMALCEPILRMEISIIRPRLIITLGAVAFEIFCPQYLLSSQVGSLTHSDKFEIDVFAIYHPSPRNLAVKERADKFKRDISNLCKIIKACEDDK